MEEGLQRFLTAQDGKRGDNTLYELALKEIQEGKPSFECWVRYVYPQLKRSGTSQPQWTRGSEGIYRESYPQRKANQSLSSPIG